MNLALLSNHDTDAGKQAINLLLSGQSILGAGAYISSQADPDRCYYHSVANVYGSLGYDIDLYMDFENEFSEPLFAEVLKRPFIHLSGGNTFRFLDAIQKRSAGHALKTYAANGGMFIGVSAGAMLLTPNIECATLCGDVNDVGLTNLNALALVPFLFEPHSLKQPENLRNLNLPYNAYMACDDDALVVRNTNILPIGSPVSLLSKP